MAFSNYISPLNLPLRKIFFVLILQVLQVSSFAQDTIYHPFLGNSNEWVILTSSPQIVIQSTHGDTLILGIVYKIIRTITAVYVREDTLSKKVYFRTNYDSTEKILYDFALVQGDSIFLTFKNSSMATGWYYVDSTGTISVLNGNRKILYLNNPNNPVIDTTRPPLLIWIEGIGSLIGPVYLEEEIFFINGGERDRFNINLICSYKNGIQEYEDNVWKNFIPIEGNCKTVNVGRNDLDSKIRLGPNPNRGKVTITTEEIPGPVKFYLYTYTGKLLSEFELSSNTDYSLDLSTNAQGMYFLKAVRKDGKGIKTFRVVKQ